MRFRCASATRCWLPPVPVLRLSLHPNGLAPRTANLVSWRNHILARLTRQIDLSNDPVLADLYKDLAGYPASDDAGHRLDDSRYGEIFVLIRLRTASGLLSFFTTTTVFGTAVDITLDELAIESFFPADAATTEALRITHHATHPDTTITRGGSGRSSRPRSSRG